VVGGVVRGRLVVRAHPWHLPLALLGSLGLAQWLAAVLGLGGAQDPLALPQLAPTRISTTSPWMTRSALVQVLAYGVLLFITVQAARRRYLRHGVLLLVGSAALPTVYGLVQHAAGNASIFGYVNRYYPSRLFGTFINANHFATFLGMSASIATGALIGWVVSGERRQLEAARGGTVVAWLVGLALATMTALFVVALVLTRSRAGVASAALGLGVLLAGLVGSLRGRAWGLGLAGAWLGASGLGVWMTPQVRERLVILLDQPTQEGRLAAWEATLQMVSAAPVFGTGLGTYRAVFPHFQQASLAPGLFQNAAHNELLEVLATVGVVGLVITAVAVCRIVGWVARPMSETDRFGKAVGWGILAALLVLFLHSLTDFPLRTPANAVFAVVAAGLLPSALGGGAIRESHTALTWRGRAVLALAGAALLGLAAAAAGREALAERLDGTEDVADEAILTAPPGDESRLLASRALDPARARYPLRLAEMYAQRGYRHVQDGTGDEARSWLERAARQYEEAIRLDPWRALPRARLAWLRGVMDATPPGAEAGRPDPLLLFRSAMAIEPRNPYPPRLLALWALRRAGGFGSDGAREREALLEVGYSAARRALGIQATLIPELAGLALEVSADYRQLVRLLPDGPSSRIDLAGFLNRLSLRLEGTEPARSQELWRAAMAAFEDGTSAAARTGRAGALIQAQAAHASALLQHHSAEQALALVRRARETLGAAPELATVEARALVALGRLGEAEPAYRDAIALAARVGQGGRQLHLLEGLARLYERLPAPERALATWREVLGLNPREGEAHVGMGRAWDALGQPERALAEYRTGVAVSPHDAGVRSRVADALFQRRLYGEAMAHWEVLVRNNPEDADAHLRLADGHERLGDPAEARRHYVEALRLVPGNARAQSALARLGASPSSP